MENDLKRLEGLYYLREMEVGWGGGVIQAYLGEFAHSWGGKVHRFLVFNDIPPVSLVLRDFEDMGSWMFFRAEEEFRQALKNLPGANQ